MRRRGVALLLESVVGLGLFAIAAVIVLGILTAVSQAGAQAREYTLALQVARAKMAQKRTVDYNSLLTAAEPAHTESVPFVQAGLQSTFEMTVQVDVTDQPPDRKLILVRVAWEHGGTPRKVELESYAVRI